MIIMSLILNPSNSIPTLVHTQNCLVDRQSTMRRLPDYRHFLDQQQQSDSHNDELYVGKNILVMVEENEQLTIPTFIAFIRQEFGYTITYRKALLEKQWALKKVYGNWEESYNIIPKFLQALQLFVPGTIVRIQTIPALDKSNQPIPNKVIFHRLFWSFKACIDVFEFWYVVTQPEFFRHYRELQEDNPHSKTWLDQIPREQWTLEWDDGKQRGHMITNLAEVTYEKLNKYFVDRGSQADAMITSRQVYTLIVAKFITKEETKSNTHFVQQVNTRERRRMGKFTVRLYQRTCDCGKPQKLHIPCAHVIAACKHINIDYLQYVSPIVYKVSLAGMRHYDYWPPYEEP
ncbi:hypothetical protein HKD37_05G012475 [Glycine soja]